MNRLKRAMMLLGAIAVLGAAYAGACKRDYDVPTTEPTHIASPTNTPTLDNLVTPTAKPSPTTNLENNVTPTPQATATPEIVGPHKLYCPTCTEKEFNNFNSALDKAWGIVKDVYGREPNDKIVVYTNASKQAYGIALMQEVLDARGSLDFLKTSHDDIGGYPISHFFVDHQGIMGIDHELAHRFNQSLFPPKDKNDPWYQTLDEALAFYADGRINRDKGNEWVDLAGLNKDGTINTMASGGIPVDEAYALLEQNPELFWKRRGHGDYNPRHVVGSDLINLSIRGGLTYERFRDILVPELARYSKGDGLTKEGIQKSFEAAGVKINYALIEKGIELLYTPEKTTVIR